MQERQQAEACIMSQTSSLRTKTIYYTAKTTQVPWGSWGNPTHGHITLAHPHVSACHISFCWPSLPMYLTATLNKSFSLLMAFRGAILSHRILHWSPLRHIVIEDKGYTKLSNCVSWSTQWGQVALCEMETTQDRKEPSSQHWIQIRAKRPKLNCSAFFYYGPQGSRWFGTTIYHRRGLNYVLLAVFFIYLFIFLFIFIFFWIWLWYMFNDNVWRGAKLFSAGYRLQAPDNPMFSTDSCGDVNYLVDSTRSQYCPWIYRWESWD